MWGAEKMEDDKEGLGAVHIPHQVEGNEALKGACQEVRVLKMESIHAHTPSSCPPFILQHAEQLSYTPKPYLLATALKLLIAGWLLPSHYHCKGRV